MAILTSSPLLNLASIVDLYDAFLIDLNGVLYDGIKLYPDAKEVLDYLQHKGKHIIFFTNSPRPYDSIRVNLDKVGIPSTMGFIVSSGDVVRYQLLHKEDSRIAGLRLFFHAGAERNTVLLKGAVSPMVNITEEISRADAIIMTAFCEHDEPHDHYDSLFRKATARGIPLICTNPDQRALHGKVMRFPAGMFAARYEAMGGQVYYYGKPYPEVYQLAFKWLEHQGMSDKKRMLAIGDSLQTDIKGAANMGIDSLLILQGIHAMDLELPTPKTLPMLFEEYGATPTFTMERLQ